jgi:hypothetical protein
LIGVEILPTFVPADWSWDMTSHPFDHEFVKTWKLTSFD